MDKILINNKMVRKNKSIKHIKKASIKSFGRAAKPVIKGKIGKLTKWRGTVGLKESDKKSPDEVLGQGLTKDPLIAMLEKEKLTGMSGNGFLVSEKLKTFIEQPNANKRMLINAVECEPGLIHDEWLLHQYIKEITVGAKLIADAIGVKDIYLAAKSDLTGFNTKIHYCKVPARYPMGEEHILIEQVFGMKLKKSDIPVNQGILVMNVQTIFQIYQMCEGSFQAGHFVTLANLYNGDAFAAYVENGTDIKKILKQQFGQCSGYYAGHGIMGAHPVEAGECFDYSISFAAVGEAVNSSNENHCKGCGRCTKACPMKIRVRDIVKRKEKNPDADVSDLGAEKCLHCNSCSFLCAAGKNIPEYME